MPDDKCPNCGLMGDKKHLPDGTVCYQRWDGGLVIHVPGDETCLTRQLAAMTEAKEKAEAALVKAAGDIKYWTDCLTAEIDLTHQQEKRAEKAESSRNGWRNCAKGAEAERDEAQAEVERLLESAEANDAYCLADGHQHANRVEEALCSLRFQRDEAQVKVKRLREECEIALIALDLDSENSPPQWSRKEAGAKLRKVLKGANGEEGAAVAEQESEVNHA